MSKTTTKKRWSFRRERKNHSQVLEERKSVNERGTSTICQGSTSNCSNSDQIDEFAPQSSSTHSIGTPERIKKKKDSTMKRFFAKLTKGRSKNKDIKRHDENQQTGFTALSSQNEVLQSSMWNTITPQRNEPRYGDCRHPESYGHPGEQRNGTMESRRDQYVVKNKHEKLKKRSMYEERHGCDDGTTVNAQNNGQSNPGRVPIGFTATEHEPLTTIRPHSGYQGQHRREPVPVESTPSVREFRNPEGPCVSSSVEQKARYVPKDKDYEFSRGRTTENNTIEHAADSNERSFQPVSPSYVSESSPKIVHYHLTIQNCDGLELHVDNPDQNLRKKTVYSADGRKLKRLSWIESPSNPIDIGSPGDPLATIGENLIRESTIKENEETVFISSEAERLFIGDEQIIIQEAPIPMQRPEEISYVSAMETNSENRAIARPISKARMDSNTQTNERFCSHQHGSSQTDIPKKHSQYTQTTAQPRASYASRARQAAARRRATSPFRRDFGFDGYSVQDELLSPSFHYNQCINGGVVPHYVPNHQKPKRSRSAERIHDYSQRGIVVEEPSEENVTSFHSYTEAAPVLPNPVRSGRLPVKERPVGRVTPTVRRSRSLPRIARLPGSNPTVPQMLDTSNRVAELELSSLSSFEEPTPPSSPGSSVRLSPEPSLVPPVPHVHPVNHPETYRTQGRSSMIQSNYNYSLGYHPPPISYQQQGNRQSAPQRNETIMDKLSRIKSDLIRMPGVLILGLRQGRIIVTLSPERSNIEDIIRFMRHHNIPIDEYECGIVSRRYRHRRGRNPQQTSTAMTCMVR